ncbi:cryptochrome/DNA photolyase family protein [Anaeromyxobacter oryzae]|uniref:Deoxyribodipyrimidine photo-lyase n=1 Tax=Anaeromyxobacter oryzae TaxID=2918170 RepID=A0ABN6N0A5_9BACT|nr:FAD-binding domain-containing protein [Anaeromyxobacter oryzae]BDG05325.1 deoxyribodipyrimidine photo-lyase [Anaeromyxobacter oryzae]
MPVPAERVRKLNAAPVRADRAFVLHWMTCTRRVGSNPALERAVDLARELKRPVLVLEALRAGYPFASDRLHAFVMEGMAENARRIRGRALHLPYLERRAGEGKGLLEALARDACAVVTDDFPTFFVPRMLAAVAPRLDVALEAVDGSCVVPFRLAGRDHPTAYAYRRFLQRTLPAWIDRLPAEDPLARAPRPGRAAIPSDVLRRWPATDLADLARPGRILADLPIDHGVAPCRRGGAAAGEARLAEFVERGLDAYAERRNDPDAEAASGLSPWLHFGHVGSFDVLRAVLRREGWTPRRLAPAANGARAGFWGLGAGAEAFLDQLLTWRELGFVTCAHRPDHRAYASLPEWARTTLARHARDRRPVRYGHDALAAAATGDPIWNAAQRQLLREGVIHGYLRMLWGKKVLEWSASPEAALEVLLDLNDRYALDGRDPNSVSGIFWCLGRYDRPWPERPIYGTVRSMSSERTAKKVALARWLARFGEPSQASLR